MAVAEPIRWQEMALRRLSLAEEADAPKSLVENFVAAGRHSFWYRSKSEKG
jgi:hypothetical protein